MSATKSATPNPAATPSAASPSAQDASRLMEDAVRGWGQAMNTWLDAQHRLMSAAMGMMPAMPAVEQFMPADTDARRSMEEAGDRIRRSTTRLVHGGVDLATSNLNEMSTVLADQSRFMGRLADRTADCVTGEHAARTPDACAATARAMMADCVENMTSVSERVVRLGARSMDTVRAMVETEVASARTSASR